MKYTETIIPAVFRSRPNRFVAYVEVEGVETKVHVKNTGRCRELLVPGCRVYLAKSENQARKTPYDLIAVEKERDGKAPLLINMDSQVPNKVVEEWLKEGHLFPLDSIVKGEVVHGDSRFDFYLEDGERKAFLEVKGCTLEEDGLASFPDAPTERGVKHLRGLSALLDEGYEAYVAIVLQMEEMREFRPNWKTHPAFGYALKEAVEKGVKLLVLGCTVERDGLYVSYTVPSVLDPVH